MGGDTPGCFGGPPGVTPNIDRLAAEGMTFGRAHVPIAICMPSRSAIMTGRWPHRSGAEGFEPIKDGVPVVTRLLRDAGYLAGILGKVEHLQPVGAFGWDFVVGKRKLGLGRDPRAYGEASAQFMRRAAAAERPWFLMANAHDPHRPFSGSRAEQARWTADERARYPPPSKVFGPDDDVTVPGFLPSLPGVVEEYREYLSSSRRCDDVVGAVLRALDHSGAADDTLVVFLSDNGIAVPFAKANCYLQSTQTPLIIRWPGVTRAGSRETEAFVSTLDLLPTCCDAARMPLPDGLDGRTLVPLLRGEPDHGREAVFTVFHETPPQDRYEMRCRQDARIGYIWNPWSDGERVYRAQHMGGLSWPAMVEAAAENAQLAERTDFYLHRVPEELYDFQRDPHSLNDVATDPAYRQELARVRQQLLGWMADTGDPLLAAYRDFLQRTPCSLPSRPRPGNTPVTAGASSTMNAGVSAGSRIVP
ncbi:MAG: sulfatase-like hydrolase/transferase [Actinophytocola sp.]|nr:sulfatase-like hydrolase/transferase [Actinophytocola sp.]